MKKISLNCVIIISLLTGCANLNKIKSETCKVTDQHGAIIEEWSNFYDKEGRTINNKRYRIKDNYYWNRSTTFNADGTVKEIIDYQNNDKIDQTTKLEYDSGKCIKDSVYDDNNNLIHYTIIKYPSPFIEICFNYNAKDELRSKEKYVYDLEGRIIKILFYNLKGNLEGKEIISYNKDFLQPIMTFHKLRQNYTKSLYTLDNRGNIIKEIRYENGVYQEKTVYEYNSNYNLSSISGFKKRKFYGRKNFIYRDDNFKLLKSFVVYDSENKIIENGEFHYTFYY